jgi:hypothetical protein
MARLFISYNHQEAAYAFAIRQWLIAAQGWVRQVRHGLIVTRRGAARNGAR